MGMSGTGFMGHPGIAAAARAAGRPAAVRETAWARGTMPLRVSGYLTAPELPLELVTSVRGIVHVRGDDGVERVVFCENADGRHPWPGGRRVEGESFEFVQLVFTATASSRDVALDADWDDADGYELGSSLQTLADACRLTSTDMLADVFVDALLARRADGADGADGIDAADEAGSAA
jgi:hypothetical protein